MKWCFLLLICGSVAAQPVVPTRRLNFQSSAAVVIPGPTNISTKMFRWWVSRDVTVGFTVSNQWTDRIVGEKTWQMNTAVSPTNAADGIKFVRASGQFLTNEQGSVGWDIGSVVAPFSGDTFYFVFIPDGVSSEEELFTEFSGGHGISMNGANLRYAGNVSGGPNSILALASTTTNDVVVTLSPTKTTWYTNGIPARTNTTGGVDDFPYTKMGNGTLGAFGGKIGENGIFTNVIFTLTDVAALHKYLTNFWKYSP